MESSSDKAGGLYRCAACAAPLFRSGAKVEAGTGYPNFTAPVEARRVRMAQRDSHGVHRTQVRCATCDVHLDHAFPDDSRPTGKRYCILPDTLRGFDADASRS